jgi:hypothetical protein
MKQQGSLFQDFLLVRPATRVGQAQQQTLALPELLAPPARPEALATPEIRDRLVVQEIREIQDILARLDPPERGQLVIQVSPDPLVWGLLARPDHPGLLAQPDPLGLRMVALDRLVPLELSEQPGALGRLDLPGLPGVQG